MDLAARNAQASPFAGALCDGASRWGFSYNRSFYWDEVSLFTAPSLKSQNVNDDSVGGLAAESKDEARNKVRSYLLRCRCRRESENLDRSAGARVLAGKSARAVRTGRAHCC